MRGLFGGGGSSPFEERGHGGDAIADDREASTNALRVLKRLMRDDPQLALQVTHGRGDAPQLRNWVCQIARQERDADLRTRRHELLHDAVAAIDDLPYRC